MANLKLNSLVENEHRRMTGGDTVAPEQIRNAQDGHQNCAGARARDGTEQRMNGSRWAVTNKIAIKIQGNNKKKQL